MTPFAYLALDVDAARHKREFAAACLLVRVAQARRWEAARRDLLGEWRSMPPLQARTVRVWAGGGPAGSNLREARVTLDEYETLLSPNGSGGGAGSFAAAVAGPVFVTGSGGVQAIGDGSGGGYLDASVNNR